MATVSIRQRKSSNGASPRQRDTLRTLGLRGIGSEVERADGPALRGLVDAVSHLVDVREGGARKAGSDG
jgi:large subunit ribosomal protein L30